jgi:hypothetical protein
MREVGAEDGLCRGINLAQEFGCVTRRLKATLYTPNAREKADYTKGTSVRHSYEFRDRVG